MSSEKIKDLLGKEWSPIIKGLENGMEFNLIFLQEKGKQTSQKLRKENFHNNDYPLWNIDRILWKKLLYADEVNDALERYGYLCVGEGELSENGENVLGNIVPYPPKSMNADMIEDEGMFLCEMKTGEHGFFDAYNGSCGYTSCCVGGSCANLYIGTYDNICNYGMDNEARRWNEILCKNKE